MFRICKIRKNGGWKIRKLRKLGSVLTRQIARLYRKCIIFICTEQTISIRTTIEMVYSEIRKHWCNAVFRVAVSPEYCVHASAHKICKPVIFSWQRKVRCFSAATTDEETRYFLKSVRIIRCKLSKNQCRLSTRHPFIHVDPRSVSL